MWAEGWYGDPFKRYVDRWFSDGRPTALVRDAAGEATDSPDDIRQWSISELSDEPAGAPQPEPLVARAELGMDPRQRNRHRAIVYVLVVAAIVTAVGLLIPRDSWAAGLLVWAAIIVPGSVWSIRNRRQRLDGELPYTAVDGAWSPMRSLVTGTGNPRYDSPSAPSRQAPDGSSSTRDETRRVYLYCDNRLIATLDTVEQAPEKSYVVDGSVYSVISYSGPYREQHSSRQAFDVQVA